MPNIGCDEHIIPHEAEHLMNSVTHRASSNPGAARTARAGVREVCDTRRAFVALRRVTAALSRMRNSGEALGHSKASATSTQVCLDALRRAEAPRAATSSLNGGTGAGGRFTAVEELSTVLRSQEAMCGAKLHEFLEEQCTRKRNDLEHKLAKLKVLDLGRAASDLVSALGVSEERGMPLVALLLCVDEHESHLERSCALCQELASFSELTALFSERLLLWLVGVRSAKQCSQLHELLAAHALPVMLCFASRDQKVALVDTVAYTDGLPARFSESLYEFCDLYVPLLRQAQSGRSAPDLFSFMYHEGFWIRQCPTPDLLTESILAEEQRIARMDQSSL
jgi:hypothetical protein